MTTSLKLRRIVCEQIEAARESDSSAAQALGDLAHDLLNDAGGPDDVMQLMQEAIDCAAVIQAQARKERDAQEREEEEAAGPQVSFD